MSPVPRGRRARVTLAALAALVLAGALARPALARLRPVGRDLTRALDGGVGRRLTSALPARSVDWRDAAAALGSGDTLLPQPVSACWLGERLVVADGEHQHLVVLDPVALDGVAPAGARRPHVVGRRGTRPGTHLGIASVRCAPDGRALLVADADARRLTLLDSTLAVTAVHPAEPVPQLPIYLGDYALAADGGWYDSWLGSGAALGPYLVGTAWDTVALARRHAPDGRRLAAIGRPTLYGHPVARRVLNRTFLALRGDTLLVLTQGDATVRHFDAAGREVRPPLVLPVYHRGVEPILVDRPMPGGGALRKTKLVYHPNVGGLAPLPGGRLAVARYAAWRLGLRGPIGGRWLDFLPRSSLDIVTANGAVERALAVPGRVLQVTASAAGRLAVVVEEATGGRRVLYAGPAAWGAPPPALAQVVRQPPVP